MSIAYVDPSVIVAIAFNEPGAVRMVQRARRFDRLIASPLLEAEVRSAAKRERIALDERLLSAIQFIPVIDTLGVEIARVLAQGYLRGADCFHVATALRIAGHPAELTFLTLDVNQRTIAAALGFKT